MRSISHILTETLSLSAFHAQDEYMEFSRNLSVALCTLTVGSGFVEQKDEDQVVDDLILALITVLDDKRNFMKMLYKSMERHSSLQNALNGDTANNRKRKSGVSAMEQVADEESAGIEHFEEILAVILMNICGLKWYRNNGTKMVLNEDAMKDIDDRIKRVLVKCDDLSVDAKTTAMIKYFFAFRFKGLSDFNGTCSTGCCVQ